ncbi:MAG: hypothetical protein JKY75_05660 [Erythrobacter sp.]|jgi:hypothetical protein|nr:hypothetical protein [Erythrobacter sp.]
MSDIPQIAPEIEQLFGHWLWIGLVIIAGLFFKEALINGLAGVRFYLNKDYNELDVVYIFNRVARITKIGMMKTTLIFYDRGTKMTIPNHELDSLRIEKSLPMADMTRLPDEKDKSGGLYEKGGEPTKEEMHKGLVE